MQRERESAPPCLLLQPVKTNCSHVSITHFPFFCSSARGPRVRLLCYSYFNYSWINTFPLARQSSSTGKSPTCWTNIHAPHNPMSWLHPLRSIPVPSGNEGGFKELSALLIMLSSAGDFPFFEGDAGATFTGKNESYRRTRRHNLLIIDEEGVGGARQRKTSRSGVKFLPGGGPDDSSGDG